MSNLRNKVIRLAHSKPTLRKDLLPLLEKSANTPLMAQFSHYITGGDPYYGDDFVTDVSVYLKFPNLREMGMDLKKVEKVFEEAIKISRIPSGYLNMNKRNQVVIRSVDSASDSLPHKHFEKMAIEIKKRFLKELIPHIEKNLGVKVQLKK